jgi:hypothetical protein
MKHEILQPACMPGRPKKYNEDTFWEAACDYFQWCDDNPIMVTDYVRRGPKAGQVVELQRVRPYTIEGLCVFLKICRQTLENYGKDPELLDIISCARNVIWSQQFTGVAVGAFSCKIVARKLGLKNKRETQIIFNDKIEKTIIHEGNHQSA